MGILGRHTCQQARTGSPAGTPANLGKGGRRLALPPGRRGRGRAGVRMASEDRCSRHGSSRGHGGDPAVSRRAVETCRFLGDGRAIMCACVCVCMSVRGRVRASVLGLCSAPPLGFHFTRHAPGVRVVLSVLATPCGFSTPPGVTSPHHHSIDN